MIIKTLVENTSISDAFDSEHGLSLYIKTNKRRILFDVGASGLFLKNAKLLGVNIADIDYLIISHGHYDHGGGLKTFLRENKTAEVFLHRFAFDKHYAIRPNKKVEYIGLKDSLKNNRQIVLTSDRFYISKGIQLFSNIIQKEPRPITNSGLLMEQNGQIIEDTFTHEQNLVIEEDGKILLITGCAHNGIVNILEHFYELKGRMPDYVIGGFHLSRPSLNCYEDADKIDKISKYLLDTKTKYYTCHCTGMEPYRQIRNTLGENIEYLKTGSEIAI